MQDNTKLEEHARKRRGIKEPQINQISKSVYDEMLNEIWSKWTYVSDTVYDKIDLIEIERYLEPILKKYLLNKDIEDE